MGHGDTRAAMCLMTSCPPAKGSMTLSLKRLPSWEAAGRMRREAATPDAPKPANALPPLERPRSVETKKLPYQKVAKRLGNRRASVPTGAVVRPPPVLPPLPGSVQDLAKKVQISRKQWGVIKAVWDDHDKKKLGWIGEAEFVKAVLRLDERKAEREGERIRNRYFDKRIGDTIGALAELSIVQGAEARARHASGMFRAVVEAAGKSEDRIELVDFVQLFFPHLPRHAVRRACEHYAEKPPPPPRTKTFEEKLDECEGAREEIQQIFERLDGDKDGLVRMKSLEPMMVELGITQKDIRGWMSDMPCGKGLGVMGRMKSKLDADDMQLLLGPTYTPPSPKPMDMAAEGEEIKQQIEFNQEVLLEVMYGKLRR